MTTILLRNLSDTSEDESIVKNLYEELVKLNIQTVQDSDNSESSADTVIEAEKKEKSQDATTKAVS